MMTRDIRTGFPHKRFFLVTCGLLALFLLAACGSTLPASKRATISPDDTLSIPTGGGEDAAAGGGAAAAAESPAGTGPGAQSVQGRALPASAGGGDGSKEVKIGIYYPTDAQQVLTAVGAQSTAPDFRAASDVMVKEINSKGGIAGRAIVPVHHGVRSQSADRPSEDQAACTDFVQDRPVVAVVIIGSSSDILSNCLAKAGIVALYSGLTIDNAASFRARPFQSQPISMNLDRVATNEVEGLAAQGYLQHAPGSQAEGLRLPVKLGLVVFDLPSFRDVFERVLEPGYRAKGTPVSEVRFVRRDTAGLSADIDSAVLAFAQRQVTHVSFLVAGGLAHGLFIVRAHSQGYQPRYGFSSQDAPQVVWADNIQKISGDSAASQYRGAVGVGWFPFGDVADSQTDPDIVPASFGRCIDVMRKGGIPPADTNYNGFLAFVCDGFWFLDSAFEAGGSARLTPSSYVAGQDSLGDSYLPATITRTRVGPGRHDGAGSIRHFAFNDACKCFRYTSPRIDI